MSHGFLDVLRFFLIALIWLFFIYAARMVAVEMLRGNAASNEDSSNESQAGLRLRVIEPVDERGKVFDLGGEVTLGRSSACVVPLEHDTFASTVHARVFPRNGELWIEDLGSTNGTFLNDRRLGAPVRLKRGDRVKVGRTLLEVGR
jgi:hypothetical protein